MTASYLVDTGIDGGEDAILECLSAVDKKSVGTVGIYEILLTHGHNDHTVAAAALVERTGARVLASTIDTPVIEGREAAPGPQLADWEMPLYDQIHPHVPPARPVHVDRQVDDRVVLEWDQPATVIAAPGHTAGSIALLFPDAQVLVAGDAIASHQGKPILGIFNADPGQARVSFERLAALDVELACFGHGDPLLGGAHTDMTRA